MLGRKDERVVFPDATVAESRQGMGGMGGGVLAAALPELGLVRKAGKRKLFLIFLAAALFAVPLAVAISWMNGKDSSAGHRGATKFATALVHNDPSGAPAGAAGYVSGVRGYFGPVSSAKVIGGHERGVNAPDSADERTYYVIEMLIQSRRGPAALEIDFDNHALGSERVSGIHELKPNEAPGITQPQRNQLEKAFAARGGKPADEEKLLATTATNPVPGANAQLDKAAKELVCVQNAHGDVTKMQACTQ
jgi:hypothetical protein